MLTNDTDIDSPSLTATLATGPANGTLTLLSNGNFTYTPNANFNGTDSFTYRASDGAANSNVATVSIAVNPVNDTPTASNDSYSVNEDGSLNIGAALGVLANDLDVEGTALSATLVSGPTHGSFALNANGSFTYTPNANFNGTDSFTYRASDGLLSSNIATVNITVNPVNDAPVASNDSYSVSENGSLNVNVAGGVLANDSDVDGDTLSATLLTPPTNGSFTLTPNGSFSYSPNANFSGIDTFTYQASDGKGGTSTATATITVVDIPSTPLTVEQILVNGGTDPQRSNIESLSVKFSINANITALIANGQIVNAVKLQNTTTNTPVSLAVDKYQYDEVSRTLRIDLTTDGFGGSRSSVITTDARLQLRLDTALVVDAGDSSNRLVDGDGSADGIHRFNFHRMLGDFTGDAAVTSADFARFNEHYLSVLGQARYDFVYDFDGNGRIDALDYVTLRRRLGTTLP